MGVCVLIIYRACGEEERRVVAERRRGNIEFINIKGELRTKKLLNLRVWGYIYI